MWCFFYEPHRYVRNTRCQPLILIFINANRSDVDCLDRMLNGSEPLPTLMLPSFKLYNMLEKAHGPIAQVLSSMTISSKRVPKNLGFQHHGVTPPFSQRTEVPLPMQYGNPSVYIVVQE